MSVKPYEGRIILKSGTGSSIPVRVDARNQSEARKLIEAQYRGQIKQWAVVPQPAKK